MLRSQQQSSSVFLSKLKSKDQRGKKINLSEAMAEICFSTNKEGMIVHTVTERERQRQRQRERLY